jgi:hypothetical protein
VYDEMAEVAVPIHITEFWANERELRESGRYSDEEIDQRVAEYVGNYLTCAFAHPAVGGFFFWGFMGASIEWKDRIDSSNEPKPAFHRIKQLIHDEWQTREQLTTDADGVVRFRGFLGDYALRYAIGENVRTGVTFRLDRTAGMPLTVIAGTR